MVGSHFAAKALILVFSIPLLSQSGISVDLKPLEQMIVSRLPAQDIDEKQIRVALKSLTDAAHMNASIGPSIEPAQKISMPDERLDAILANLDTLLVKAAAAKE